MHKVFITRSIPDNCKNTLLKEGFKVSIWPKSLPPTDDELLKNAKDATALITTLSDKITEKLMTQCPNLKVISNFAVGYNNIDLGAANKNNIQIGNTPDVLTDATADLAFTLTLAAARNLRAALFNFENNEWKTWEPIGFLGQELKGKTLGIIGLGRIGKRFAEIFQGAYGGEILYWSRSHKQDFEKKYLARKVELETLLSESDIVSIHCDLNEKTKELINKDTLSLMKESSILINTARGEIIDQNALYHALKEKKISAAGLDVTTPEPLPKNSPLRSLENIIILPHIGSATKAARENMANICARNTIAGIRGEKIPFAINLN